MRTAGDASRSYAMAAGASRAPRDSASGWMGRIRQRAGATAGGSIDRRGVVASRLRAAGGAGGRGVVAVVKPFRAARRRCPSRLVAGALAGGVALTALTYGAIDAAALGVSRSTGVAVAVALAAATLAGRALSESAGRGSHLAQLAGRQRRDVRALFWIDWCHLPADDLCSNDGRLVGHARSHRGAADDDRDVAAVAFARSAGSPFRHPRRDCDCRRSRGVRAGLDRSGCGRNVFGVGRRARGRSVRRCAGAGCGAADGRRRHVGLQQSGRTGIGSQSRGGPHCRPHCNHQPRRCRNGRRRRVHAVTTAGRSPRRRGRRGSWRCRSGWAVQGRGSRRRERGTENSRAEE